MMTLQEFAKHLERVIVSTKPALSAGLVEIGEHTKHAAKDAIGREMPHWPALADSTIAEKQRLGYVGQVSGTDPLLRSGELRESIGAAVEGLKLEVGSTSKIGLWQEVGTPKIPARPFIAPAAINEIPHATKVLGTVAAKLLTPRFTT